ncbi:tRNA pseudouridine synthase B [Labeo rohita]|uniref:tRNA pseudouridine synthase B n=1 Tax=Labeo rohita TaxID=84645 RepID=A0ABQ8L7Y7_LABRO|nr:tRNA pseudouridine synthase B [Labeo rohita]
MEGKSVFLYSDVTKQQRDKMLWYFDDTLIALINGEPSKSCMYDGEGGMFRDRLKVDYATGSLTITNIRPEHTGRYEANFIQSKSSGTSHNLNRNSKCNSTKIIKKMSNIGDTVKTFSVSVIASLSYPDQISKELDNMEKKQEFEKDSVLSLIPIVGICGSVSAVLLMVAVVGVMYCRYRSANKGKYQVL